MVDITEETEIQLQDVIYNPFDKEFYTVWALHHNLAPNTVLFDLIPFSKSKSAFAISQQEMIEIGYQLKK